MDIKLKQVTTPEGVIKQEDIAEVHKKEWQEMIAEMKSKHMLCIERFRSVLEKQIVEKIVKSYMSREEQSKILNSYQNLVEWIQETRKGNFMKSRFYTDLYFKVMNNSRVHISEQKLKGVEMKDLRTYAFIRLTGYLDSYMNEKHYMDEDYVRFKKQQLENFEQAELAEFLKIFNEKPA